MRSEVVRDDALFDDSLIVLLCDFFVSLESDWFLQMFEVRVWGGIYDPHRRWMVSGSDSSQSFFSMYIDNHDEWAAD